MNQDTAENTRTNLIKRFWWAPLVGVPLAVLLMLGLRDFVRETFALPLSYLIWLVGILTQTIPQVWLWTGLVVIALIFAMRSLDREPANAAPGNLLSRAGRDRRLGQSYQYAADSKYSRHRFGYFISKLILGVLSLRNVSISES